MKTPFVRFVLCLIVSCLSYITSSQTVAAPLPLAEDFCGVVDYKLDNRNYAKSLTVDLNVGEPRTVRMIYFLPNDRPYRADVVQRMKDEIRNIQTFYAESMQAHGYDMTFQIETDVQGEPVVHRVDGQHPDNHYIVNTARTVLSGEIRSMFDMTQNIYFIVIDNSTNGIGFTYSTGRKAKAGGIGSGEGKNGGVVLIPGRFTFETAAHELGHAFRLQHDFRSGGYIMSYGVGANRAPRGGPDQDRLSACNADFLAVHPYFNPDIPTETGQKPTIELTSPSTYPTGSKSVNIQIKVNDSEGIHQVILLASIKGMLSFTNNTPEVKACLKLIGEKKAVVEFEYDGDIPSSLFTSLIMFSKHEIRIAAIDINGDVGYRYFTLSEILPEKPPPIPKTLVKISGDNQQGKSGTTLINPLVVEVRDLNSNPLSNVTVKFTVVLGSGKLDKRFTTANIQTDAHGQAGSILTLGTSPGTNTVEVSASEGEPVMFNAVGVGKSTISLMDGNYQTWGVPTGIRLCLGKGGVGEMENAIAFSPDGQYLAVSSNIGIWLYDAITYQELTLLPNSVKISTLAFSPDGKTLVSGAGGDMSGVNDWKINLWDVVTREKIAAFGKGTGPVAFSPDGKIIASRDWRTVYLWDIITGQKLAEFGCDNAKSISFSPDGTLLASGGEDNVVKIWNVATGQNLHILTHKSKVNSVAFSPDGKTLASGSYDTTIKLWDVATGKEIIKIQKQWPIGDVAFSPDGKTLAWSSARKITVWDIATQTNLIIFEASTGGQSVAFSPDGKILVSASSYDGIVNLWDIETGNTVDLGHTKIASSASFSPDSTILAAGTRDGTIKLWDVVTGANVDILLGKRGTRVHVVASSPDGRTIASHAITEQFIRIWDIATQTMTATLGRESVTALTFSPDGKMLASGTDNYTIQLWDVVTMQNIATLEGHTYGITSLAFSPDGKMLASGAGDKTIKLWDIVTRQNIATLTHKSYHVPFLAFLSDGKILASRIKRFVKLWDVETQTLINTFEILPFSRPPYRLPIGNNGFTVLSTDGTRILKYFQGSLSLWDATTLTLIDTLEGFAPNSKTFALKTYHDVIFLGDMETIKGMIHTERMFDPSADFSLTVKEGQSFIHIPLKVTSVNGVAKTIKSVGDLYDALGGTSYVFRLSTWDRSSDEWIYYSKPSDRGTLADKKLTDDMGIKAQMWSTVTIGLRGDALGANGRSTITLHPGTNVVGIPLKDSRLKEISDLFSLDGIRDNVWALSSNNIRITVYNGQLYAYDLYLKSIPITGIPITGGQVFLLTCNEEATVTFYGEKWTNERPTSAATSIVGAINRVETNLLHNYPNPFNPETWIPFRLAEDANVMLTIYDVGGRMVRQLDIGHSKAGIYESRDKAIYWDGRNDLGESVASGIYFYHLMAGEYSATKRMVILK